MPQLTFNPGLTLTLVADVCQSGHLCDTPTLPAYARPLLKVELKLSLRKRDLADVI